MDPLWITYAWKDDEGGDFSYLVQELESVGVPVVYDKIALVPGQRLWQQIAEEITRSPLSGWASLLTNSLYREGCAEELEYAVNRALKEKGEGFPLIGLLHEVQIEEVPPPLAVRLCVNLASPDWREEVRAGVERRAPERIREPQTRFVLSVHQNYGGNPSHTAIEVRPRFGTMMYWRFIVPASATVTRWGWGPAGGRAISGNKETSVDGGTTELQGTACTYFGTGNPLSSSISAYAVFEGQAPDFVAFGQAEEPYGPPGGEVEVFAPGP